MTKAYDTAIHTSPIAVNTTDFHAFFILVSSHSAVKSSYAMYSDPQITTIGSINFRSKPCTKDNTEIISTFQVSIIVPGGYHVPPNPISEGGVAAAKSVAIEQHEKQNIKRKRKDFFIDLEGNMSFGKYLDNRVCKSCDYKSNKGIDDSFT